MMTIDRVTLISSVVLLALTHGVAFYAGIRVGEPRKPTSLGDKQRARLEKVVEEKNAQIANLLANPKEVITYVPTEIAETAKALAAAAGEEAEEALAFNLTPVKFNEQERVDFLSASFDRCDPCLPGEFTFSGIAQRFSEDTWTLNSKLRHAHGEEIIWERDMQGDFLASAPLVRKNPKWFFGPLMSADYDGAINGGVIGGRIFNHFSIVGQFKTDQIGLGAVIRFGNRHN